MLLTEDKDNDDGPPLKRLKINKANMKLEPVLGDEVTQPVPLIPVLAANIRNKKYTSLLVKKLNDKLPIANLQHLKRVNRDGSQSISPRTGLKMGPGLHEFYWTGVVSKRRNKIHQSWGPLFSPPM